jgi:outer membrane biosynthesis protein TonB
MEFLSLQDPVEEPAGRRLTIAEAIGLSVIAHVLLLLLLWQGPGMLPAGLRHWLETRPARPTVVAMQPIDAATKENPELKEQKPETAKIPLKFAYVKVPNDVPTAPNKEARLLSDRDRRARQEVPTPSDVKSFSRDPHSVGDTRDRVRPDPTIPEGPDPAKATAPRREESPSDNPVGLADRSGRTREAAGDPAEKPAPAEGDPGDAMIAHGDLVPPANGPGASPPPTPGDRSGRGGTVKPGRRSGAPAGGGARLPSDNEPRTEYKFQFSNTGWLKGGAYGTMSFDTQGFPWGDYARLLYVAIRNNWLERIPLAAREGIAGHTCQHFKIARDGEITALEVVRPSEVPPFTKAASDAIRASSRLPPLPEDFPDAEEGVTFCFYYNMYPAEAD